MAKQGFQVMDSDIHVLEPQDLWLQHIEPKFKDRAPQRVPLNGDAEQRVWQFADKVFPAFIDDPERRRLARVRNNC